MQNATLHDGRRGPAAAAERGDDVGGEGTWRERMRGPKTDSWMREDGKQQAPCFGRAGAFRNSNNDLSLALHR